MKKSKMVVLFETAIGGAWCVANCDECQLFFHKRITDEEYRKGEDVYGWCPNDLCQETQAEMHGDAKV